MIEKGSTHGLCIFAYDLFGISQWIYHFFLKWIHDYRLSGSLICHFRSLIWYQQHKKRSLGQLFQIRSRSWALNLIDEHRGKSDISTEGKWHDSSNTHIYCSEPYEAKSMNLARKTDEENYDDPRWYEIQDKGAPQRNVCFPHLCIYLSLGYPPKF